mmetsp:Transcript_23996/g.95224  ORF Transcript_23996/g.95224 Transcript_23996/m.95224 type:complete len:222 (-) Transcript_23996:19-684(-)
MRQRVAHAGLRREVDDVRELVSLEQGLQQRRVAHVALDHREPELLPQSLRSRAFVERRVIRVEVVEADDRRRSPRGVPRRERGHQRRPNKARAARHEHARVSREDVPSRVVLRTSDPLVPELLLGPQVPDLEHLLPEVDARDEREARHDRLPEQRHGARRRDGAARPRERRAHRHRALWGDGCGGVRIEVHRGLELLNGARLSGREACVLRRGRVLRAAPR